MGRRPSTQPGAAPVPVTVPARAPATTDLTRARTALHAQSYGKQVGAVTTLFGTATPPHDEARAQVPRQVLAALAATRVGEELGPDLPFGERVHAAAVEAVRVRRFSPADRYPVHRAYPSPRGLFGADVHVLVGTGPALRVDPHDGSLRGPDAPGGADGLDRPDGPGGAADLASAAGTPALTSLGATDPGTRLTVSAHPDRFPEPDGTLRGSLALLEAGHLAATLALTASRAGLAPGVDLGTSGGTVARVRFDDGPAAIGADCVMALDAVSAPGTDRLDAWLDRRTSGWSHENLVTSRSVPGQRTAGVTHALQRALAVLTDVLPPDGVRLYAHHLVDDSMTHRTARRLDVIGEPYALVGEASFLSATGYTLTADLDRWLERYGDDATVVLHTALGFVAQWACLAGAAYRLTVRPARSFDEAQWGAALALPVRHTVAYQLWLRGWPSDGDARTPWSLLGVEA